MSLAVVVAHWPSIVGLGLAKRAQPVRLDPQGRLFVRVHDRAYARGFRDLRSAIRVAANRKVGHCCVREVFFEIPRPIA